MEECSLIEKNSDFPEIYKFWVNIRCDLRVKFLGCQISQVIFITIYAHNSCNIDIFLHYYVFWLKRMVYEEFFLYESHKFIKNAH